MWTVPDEPKSVERQAKIEILKHTIHSRTTLSDRDRTVTIVIETNFENVTYYKANIKSLDPRWLMF